MNNVDICNMALGQIGAKRILSLDSETEEAKQCAQYYDVCRQDLLREVPWSFAKRVKAVALTTHEMQDWRYAYALPDDCLFIRSLYSEGMRRISERHLEYFEVVNMSSSVSVIATNIKGAYLEYTYDLENVDLFPADFRKALVYCLASELSGPLSASSSQRQECYSLYQVYLEKAAKANGNENKERTEFVSEIMKARNGG